MITAADISASGLFTKEVRSMWYFHRFLDSRIGLEQFPDDDITQTWVIAEKHFNDNYIGYSYISAEDAFNSLNNEQKMIFLFHLDLLRHIR